MQKQDPRLNNHYNIGREHLPKCIICDLDGTLALLNGRSPYDGHLCETDVLNESVAYLLNLIWSMDEDVLVYLFSGRSKDNNAEEKTIKWLNDNHVSYDALIMREAGDYRKDSVVKSEMFMTHIHNKFQVLFVLDDRNQVVNLWRGMGLDCFQVYNGDF